MRLGGVGGIEVKRDFGGEGIGSGVGCSLCSARVVYV